MRHLKFIPAYWEFNNFFKNISLANIEIVMLRQYHLQWITDHSTQIGEDPAIFASKKHKPNFRLNVFFISSNR